MRPRFPAKCISSVGKGFLQDEEFQVMKKLCSRGSTFAELSLGNSFL